MLLSQQRVDLRYHLDKSTHMINWENDRVETDDGFQITVEYIEYLMLKNFN
jgi:hypothetical protein